MDWSALADRTTSTTSTPLTAPPKPQKQLLVDIGANLAHKSFSKDLQGVLNRAYTAGVGCIIITGTSLSSSKSAIDLCKSYQGKTKVRLYCTVGIHLHDASKHVSIQGLQAKLERLISDNREVVVAVGECGLDYDRNFNSHAEQQNIFELQLRIAEKMDMPSFLHERESHDEFSAMLGKHSPCLGKKGVVHCLTSGSVEALKTYLEMAFYIVIAGYVADSRPGGGAELVKIVAKIPMDRLLVETDAPLLIPRNVPAGLRRQYPQNEPALLGYVVQKIAELYSAEAVTAEELTRKTTDNAISLFGLHF